MSLCAILTVGTELTRGEIVDTNASWLASNLTSLGFEVAAIRTVDDHRERIKSALLHLVSLANVVVVTGGLGPTSDDITAQCAAEVVSTELVQDEASFEMMKRRFQALGRALNPSSVRQVMVPKTAEVLGNPTGMAPAFKLQINQAQCFFMPGVPSEMYPIFEQLVTPRIGMMVVASSYQCVLRTYGLPESVINEKLSGLENQIPGLQLGYRLSFPEVFVKILARDKDMISARASVERAASEVRARLQDVVFGEEDDSFAGVVGRSLRSRGYTLAVAESCTGGLIGTLLTQVPGSSDYLLADAVTYANSAKTKILGVPEDLLIAYGAVSPECVTSMAQGVREIVGANIGLAVSGIAGPSGGTSEKPVGLVHFAICTENHLQVVEKRFTGERTRIQRAAAYFALNLVRELCIGPVLVSDTSRCG